MFSARPEKTLGELFDDDAYRAAVQTAQEALDTQDARSRNQAEKSRLTALRESFVPWRTLDLPLETGGTQHARVLLGTVPAQTELDALRETVYGAAGEAQVERISADLQSQYLLVIVHKGAYDAAASALREFGFTTASFDGASGTAEENIRLTDEKLAACEQEDKRLTDKLTALAGDVPAIRLAADRCTQEISRRRPQTGWHTQNGPSVWTAGCRVRTYRSLRRCWRNSAAHGNWKTRRRRNIRTCRSSSRTTG